MGTDPVLMQEMALFTVFNFDAVLQHVEECTILGFGIMICSLDLSQASPGVSPGVGGRGVVGR